MKKDKYFSMWSVNLDWWGANVFPSFTQSYQRGSAKCLATNKTVQFRYLTGRLENVLFTATSRMALESSQSHIP
jgi:hypothetical protein